MSEENKTVFDLNDRVSAFGVEGIVLSIKDDAYYPIYVEFDNKHYAGFTKDGKYQCWHLEPSLKLIEKAKRKVAKTIEVWVNVYPNDIIKVYYRSKLDADACALDRIACVRLEGVYEVEE